MTKALEQRFSQVGRQDSQGENALVIARYFTPDSGWTWLATEYEPQDRLFFGYVCGQFDEWGSFSLAEMQQARGPMGLPIERDLYFGEKTLREALRDHGRSYPTGVGP